MLWETDNFTNWAHKAPFSRSPTWDVCGSGTWVFGAPGSQRDGLSHVMGTKKVQKPTSTVCRIVFSDQQESTEWFLPFSKNHPTLSLQNSLNSDITYFRKSITFILKRTQTAPCLVFVIWAPCKSTRAAKTSSGDILLPHERDTRRHEPHWRQGF